MDIIQQNSEIQKQITLQIFLAFITVAGSPIELMYEKRLVAHFDHELGDVLVHGLSCLEFVITLPWQYREDIK